MYIKTIEIENLRCFKKAGMEFLYPECGSESEYDNINLILGDNGSGKSSVLKSVVLAVLGSVLSDSGFRPYYLVRSPNKAGRDEANVKATAVFDGDVEGEEEFRTGEFGTGIQRFGVENSFNHNQTALTVDGRQVHPKELRIGDTPGFFLCGYGAGRTAEVTANYDRASRIKGRSQRYQRVAGLFEEHFTLTPIAPWLMQISGGLTGTPHHHHDSFVQILNNLLLGTGIRWTRSIHSGEAEFQLTDDPEIKLPTDALSDGFRAYLSWIIDLLSQLTEVCPKDRQPDDISGVVLVDEVDLHLHPSWQRRLLPNLSRAFPKLQFIVTSHSPILAGTLPDENIHVVERTPEGPSIITKADKSYYGRAIDEILTGDYFELESVLPPELEAKKKAEDDQRAELARKVLSGGSQEDAQAYLRSLEHS